MSKLAHELIDKKINNPEVRMKLHEIVQKRDVSIIKAEADLLRPYLLLSWLQNVILLQAVYLGAIFLYRYLLNDSLSAGITILNIVSFLTIVAYMYPRKIKELNEHYGNEH